MEDELTVVSFTRIARKYLLVPASCGLSDRVFFSVVGLTAVCVQSLSKEPEGVLVSLHSSPELL